MKIFGGRTGYQGNRNRNNNNSNTPKRNQFKGLAGSDTALYEKVVTVGPNQSTQIVDLTDALVTYCGSKGYGKWAESITELNRFNEADFVGAPPSQSSYGTITANVFTYSATGAEQYKIAYDMWKARYNHTLKDFIEYEKNAVHIFLALKGQFEQIAWDDLQHDGRYATVVASQCPVQLIELLQETCSTNETSTWEPLARLRHIRKSITYMQKPKNASSAVDTAQYKRHLSVYVNNACRAGGDFVFGTKLYEPFLADNGQTLISYLGMNASDKKIYDKKVNDMVVGILMIEGCKSKGLKTNLKNQFLTGNADCYPVTASKAYELIDKYEDDGPPTPNDQTPRTARQKKAAAARKAASEQQDDGNVAGAHVHENETETTKALVLAAVSDSGIIHQNAFEPIMSRDEFEDEDLGEVACIIIGDHYYPSDDEDDRMPALHDRAMEDDSSSDGSEDSNDPFNIVHIDGQDDSTYMTNDSMDFDNDDFSYDDSIGDEMPGLRSRTSMTSSVSSASATVGNGDIQTVICEASYVCDTDEDSSAATFTSHDDSVITNIGILGSIEDPCTSMNITSLNVPIRMEQSVRQYLVSTVVDPPKLAAINGKKTNNIANMVDIRQRFGGNIQMYRKESKYLGRSTTQFTLYKMLPYLYRSGRPKSIFPDQFETLNDVMTCDISVKFEEDSGEVLPNAQLFPTMRPSEARSGHNKLSRGNISLNALVLDSGASLHLFANADMLQNVIANPSPTTIHCGGKSWSNNQVGELCDDLKTLPLPQDTLHLHKDGVANLISLAELSKLHRITLDTSVDNAFYVYKDNGEYVRFGVEPNGLYCLHVDDGSSPATLLTTVEEEKKLFSALDVKRATTARYIQDCLCLPSDEDFAHGLETGAIKECGVSRRNINIAKAIFGPNKHSVQGKTVQRTNRMPREDQILGVPPSILKHYSDVTVGIDVMHVYQIHQGKDPWRSIDDAIHEDAEEATDGSDLYSDPTDERCQQERGSAPYNYDNEEAGVGGDIAPDEPAIGDDDDPMLVELNVVEEEDDDTASNGMAEESQSGISEVDEESDPSEEEEDDRPRMEGLDGDYWNRIE
ncbi:hypothetical protein FRACYDRAFT_251618 [Fragilariopsis cylindrus CCMP1102]|uniref:Uncharacterized protein n=1 Tax=Fragilariopsis cylindrus CCMP1102 TaxID=635003 RepID=A0A1E7EML8_9STRA|nr:hypothetical protein FRACYDRAFT_251618 [Fragilariopsis cylindrus CCMP1102]|eukprot:OEU07145.1 hypothetical protein FRACYDRAFT_251618 [Fragilariopsis cylindrus CCMP1102]